jgi:myo-inositol-1(or 4)-monophosphatase
MRSDPSGISGIFERVGTPREGQPYWLVDPICGTRPFASNTPVYCTNVALVEDGEVTVARNRYW